MLVFLRLVHSVPRSQTFPHQIKYPLNCTFQRWVGAHSMSVHIDSTIFSQNEECDHFFGLALSLLFMVGVLLAENLTLWLSDPETPCSRGSAWAKPSRRLDSNSNAYWSSGFTNVMLWETIMPWWILLHSILSFHYRKARNLLIECAFRLNRLK